MDELGGKCPYAVIGVPETATEKEIRKAYKKKALKLHPDKNPDRADAPEIFLQLVRAHEILTDEKAKEAYDRVLKLKQAAKLRDLALSAEQRAAKEDLERREAAASKRRRTDEVDAKQRLEAEVARLRAHGQQRLEQERERLLREAEAEEAAARAGRDRAADAAQPTDIKLKWKVEGVDASNGGYTADAITRLLSKYGPVEVAMGKKEGRAMATFDTAEDALCAIEFERGLPANPLTEVRWAGDGDAPLLDDHGPGSAPFAAPAPRGLGALESEALANLRRAAAGGGES